MDTLLPEFSSSIVQIEYRYSLEWTRIIESILVVAQGFSDKFSMIDNYRRRHISRENIIRCMRAVVPVFVSIKGYYCSSLACEAIGSTDSYESYRLFPSQGPNDSPSSPGRLSRLYYTMTEVIHAQLHSSLIYRLTFRI